MEPIVALAALLTAGKVGRGQDGQEGLFSISSLEVVPGSQVALVLHSIPSLRA